MESAVPPTTKGAIAHLANSNEALLNSQLTELTGLNHAEIELLKAEWPSIETQRRQQVISRLVELAEDNLEFNFDSIFILCLKDPDEQIRSRAIEGLWENEEASLIEPLVNLLEKDSSEQVQTAATMALGKFAILAEDSKLRPNYIARLQQALLAVINDKDRPMEVRRRALEAAAPLSLSEVKEAITEAYQSLDPRLKTSSIYAMGKSLDPAWLPKLLKELSSPDAELRYEACGACGDLEEEAAVPGLVKLVNDSDTDVQVAAIRALGKIGSVRARECLKQCVRSKNDAVRQAAEQALSEISIREGPLSSKL